MKQKHNHTSLGTSRYRCISVYGIYKDPDFLEAGRSKIINAIVLKYIRNQYREEKLSHES